ncbi:MAG: hypothetical protein QOC75_2780, partial [Pseudonocardiales bacterium]|nr:hypothetical protein [Pseudonocardiales bacterium]
MSLLEVGDVHSSPGSARPALVRDFDHVFGAAFIEDPFAAFEQTRGDRAFWS